MPIIADLPAIPREDFNRIAKTISGAVCLSSDTELAFCKPSKASLDSYVKGEEFTEKFANQYRRVGEIYRRELVKKELARTKVVTIKSNLDDYKLNPAQKQMLADILDLGQTMEEAYQRQRGALAYKQEVETKGTRDDREFYQRYQSVWCDDLENRYCNAVFSLPKFSTPLYPDGVNCEKDIKGDDLTNPFSVVRQDVTGKLRAIPYAEDAELKYIQAVAAAKANKTAASARKAGEEGIAKYLEEVALALQSKKPYPYAKSDEAWLVSKDSKFFLRVGPDEDQDDKTCGTRAQFHMLVGIVDPAGSKKIEGFLPYKQEFEEYLASLVPGYKVRQINIAPLDSVNVIREFGDSRGNTKGTAVGQTLPNWGGENGKADPKTRIMIYKNKTQKAYSKEMLDAFAQILSKNVLDQADLEEVTNTIIHHELAHNLGPQKQNYQGSIGDLIDRIEEMKAEIGGLALRPLFEKRGLADPEKRKSGYAGLLFWCLGHIRRGSYRGENFYKTQSPYQQLAAVIVGHFTEKGAFTYNNGTWDIDYDKCPEAASSLYTAVGSTYLKANRQAVADFFMQYTSGTGLQALHLDRINETIAKVPSTLFDYKITGLKPHKRKRLAAGHPTRGTSGMIDVSIGRHMTIAE